MRAKHTLQIEAKCPVNNKTDKYTLEVTTNRLVKVEDIMAIVKEEASGDAVFQEELTEQLAFRLKCKVKTTGTHSGVETIVVCKG